MTPEALTTEPPLVAIMDPHEHYWNPGPVTSWLDYENRDGEHRRAALEVLLVCPCGETMRVVP